MPSKRPQLNVRLADEDYDRLRHVALSRRQTPTGLARQAIKAFLTGAEATEAPPRG